MDEEGGFMQGCSSCGCPSFNAVWSSTFGVQLCDSCRRDEPLIAKGAAKAAYLLTDKDLRGLGCLSRANPQHKSWAPMQLYLQSQVEAVAQRRHGSVEQLQELRHDRMEAKLQDSLGKRQRQQQLQQQQQQQQGGGAEGEAQQGSSGGGEGRGESAAQRRIRQRLEREYSGAGVCGAGEGGGAERERERERPGGAGAGPPPKSEAAGEQAKVEVEVEEI